MRRQGIFIKFISLLMALCCIGSAGLLTAYAEPENGSEPAETQADPLAEYLNGADGQASDRSAPEALDELPKAGPGEVSLASAVTIPREKTSDASLLPGIVMWLLVALGIAVVVGVLVSKRTSRRR